MAKKVSKNSRSAADRAAGQKGSKDFVKVVKSIKDPVTGKYTYRETFIHKDNVKEFFAK